ncbi:hypothetical protein KAS79_03890 [Candidatus Parcubacteria bacterium]|nr:hypothetical protein [Candidatus Parcubacteria bacterium]
MKKLLKKVLCLFSTLSCVCLALPFYAADAQVDSLGMSVSPQVFELDVFPGETFLKKIKLGNLSDAAMPVAVRLTDFTAADETGEMLFDESSQDISFASRKWFEIENSDFILEPKEKRYIDFSIKIPGNAEPGGHYAVMLFEPQLPSFYFKEGQPRSIPVVGVLFLFSVKTLSLEPVETEKQVEIVEFSIPKEQRLQNLEKLLAFAGNIISEAVAADISIVEKTPSDFILRIKNNDIFHHKISGKILVYDFLGRKVGETEVRRTTILPGKTRRFPVGFSPFDFLTQNTPIGKYKVVLDLGEEKSALNINQAIIFWALPWKISFILLFIGIGLFLARKRIIASLRALAGMKHGT